jgi:predicted RNase H-like HicB family nuclease
MEITVVVHHEGKRFWSEVNELPGCFATAGTLSELHETLADAVGLYLWDMPAQIPDEPLVVGETTMEVTPAPPGRKAPA